MISFAKSSKKSRRHHCIACLILLETYCSNPKDLRWSNLLLIINHHNLARQIVLSIFGSHQKSNGTPPPPPRFLGHNILFLQWSSENNLLKTISTQCVYPIKLDGLVVFLYLILSCFELCLTTKVVCVPRYIDPLCLDHTSLNSMQNFSHWQDLTFPPPPLPQPVPPPPRLCIPFFGSPFFRTLVLGNSPFPRNSVTFSWGIIVPIP